LGTKSQHATPRPPKPLTMRYPEILKNDIPFKNLHEFCSDTTAYSLDEIFIIIITNSTQ
jgi:hypothetical protein